ncbi:hypothetical protein [Synoicihabitans lomoniglobus]|uniref:SH3b domain-containing protein n=1 Tax=Synoicihabitans lomoniglobus TaxID=2909285 RepID=A0AAF0CR27_9BACT|nr:hypothetical protein [Opitutaceae bacterium LMO-M01]WED66484.1 hypothetical protein PXH66_06435 [Opitutaceae bacterium LMO-M01]
MLVKTLSLLTLLAAPIIAQTATRATPVHTEPSPTAPVALLVKAGDPIPSRDYAVTAPAGWTAVKLPGPHEVYVENRFIGKDLDVKPGSPLHAAAKSDSPVLMQSAANEDLEITGLRGRWTQLRVKNAIVGYIQSDAAPAVSRTAPAITRSPVQDAPPRHTGSVSPAHAPVPTAGRQITRSAEERSSLAALPRLFEGKLASTRAPLRPRRPYDFALEAEDGTRFAYLDLTKLLLTEQIEKYLDRTVVVYGVARPVPETKDIVIAVESLQMR